MRLKVTGGKELARDLRKLGDTSTIKHIVSTNGLDMQRHAKIIAPVDTGFLKRSITLAIEKGGYQVRVSSNAEYAGIQEKYYTPHIEPAFDRQKPKFLNNVRRSINGGRS